jgi:NAD(P)-dependent dehydrogenase (short-subunit alcohol dehydrogenase family)
MPVALVTGASSGIGQATALRLLHDGFSVVGSDLQVPDLDAPPGTFAGIAGDVSEQSDNERAVAMALDRFGSLDAVCLNAGVTGSGPIDSFPLEDFERIVAVDLKGPVLGVRAALTALRRSGGPRSIVVTASTSGLGGDPGMWAYNAAKAGAVNLVRSLALELGPEGIRVNAVCPGPTVTAMTARLRELAPDKASELTAAIPLQRWAAPEEVAAAIAFLVSSQASFITGVALPVDGGVTATTGQFRPAAVLR